MSKTADVTRALRAVALTLPPEATIGFVAGLERNAALRYRLWADRSGSPILSAGLRVCAAREEGIAAIAESAFPVPPGLAPAVSQALEQASTMTEPVHRGRSLRQSLEVQAAAERVGAATWRELVARCTSESQRWALETCATLEEESASLLDRMLALDIPDRRSPREASG